MPAWYEVLSGWVGVYLVRVLQAAIVALVAYFAVKYLDKIVSLVVRIEEHEYLERFMLFLKAIIYSIAVLIAISFLAVEPTVFAVLLLAVGLAVIVMFSDVLRNLGSEFYVRNSKLFRIGDWVEIDGVQGRVARMDSMGVVLETLRRERVYIPYSRVAHTTVVNRMSAYGLSLRLRVRVPKTYDASRARELLASALQEVRGDLLAEPSVVMRSATESHYLFEVVMDIMNVGKVERVYERVLIELKARDPAIDVEF